MNCLFKKDWQTDFREIFICLYDSLFKVGNIGEMKGMYGRRIKEFCAQTQKTDNVSIKEEKQIISLVCRIETVPSSFG